MDIIINDLVNAGYFRARITSLSDFDKIIGGMAWTMQVFSQEIDIDIFYKDNLDLGRKIALTERLVMVLLAANCPLQLEPHQIVGLDYINIVPVIRWLIKRSTEIRKEHEAFNRLLALRYFFRVTNDQGFRWSCRHVLPVSDLRKFTASNDTNDQIDQAASSLDNFELSKPTRKFLAQIKEDFKDNQQVSLINMPHLLMEANQDGYLYKTSLDHEEDENDDEDENEDVYEKYREPNESPETNTDELGKESNENPSEPTTDIYDASQVQAKTNEGLETEATIHRELDTEMLATNQKILNLMKKLDSMPCQLEISQYQRRYIELHQQLISKNKDLKKIYSLFNSLDSIRYYLSKEINLLDSIGTNLDLINENPQNREHFLIQFQEIITKIQDVQTEIATRLNEAKRKRAILSAEYALLSS